MTIVVVSEQRWTHYGHYNFVMILCHSIFFTRSAYLAQFLGAIKRTNNELIWQAHAKNKCKLFVWILIQNKILTADNLALCGWPHQTSCPLCNGPSETGLHLCLHYPFAQLVWTHVCTWEQFRIPQNACPANFDSIIDWWEVVAKPIHKNLKRDFNGMVT